MLISRRRLITLLLACALFAPRAQALVVGTTPDTVPATGVSPADYAGWTQGDPGWDNVTLSGGKLSGATYVYLGNQWVLTARHVGVWTAHFSSGSFSPVPGEAYIIKNPPPNLAGGQQLTTETDLRLIRINGNPGLPSLAIGSQSPALGDEVVFITDAYGRRLPETRWNVVVGATNDPDGSPHWTWNETTEAGQYQGYKTNIFETKRWGTNHLVAPNSFESAFREQTLSATTGVLPLKTPDNITRDVISLVTRYDAMSANPFEAQAVGGDSGGAVFHNVGTESSPQWVLAGIVNAQIAEEDQPSAAIYGNGTTFADLSYYNQAYNGSICDIRKVCGNYSILGDVNLDGIVSGDGTGDWADDDVTAFVDGWRFNNGAGAGDYQSWIRGDLNLNGVVDVADFFILRGVLSTEISSTVLATLFGGSSVPEPSALLLVATAGIFLAGCARRHRV